MAIVYTDYDLDFTTNVFTQDIAVKTDIQAIRQSITNLLLTRKGERFFSSSNKGVGIQDLYFELQTISPTFLDIRDRVKRTINNYDSRVAYKNFTIAQDEKDEQGNTLIVTTTFTVNITTPDEPGGITQITDGVVITIEGPSNG